MKVHTDLFTGLRPTGDLTLANYIGAIKPVVDLQKKSPHTIMFVADMHGLTDQEPKTVSENRYSIAADYIALGLDTSKANIFVQSAIKEQVLFMALVLSRHLTVSELMRVPALKDKLKNPENPEAAKVMLANYPIMMAADILLQGAETVPVGEDQISHLEVTRLLARRFNKQYGDVLREPQPQVMKSLRIMSLTGDGKMSKSKPNGAILLNEDPQSAAKKVKRAETAKEGEMTPALESHFTVAYDLANDNSRQQLDEIKEKHLKGEKVMGDFKSLLAELVVEFLTDYQKKREQILADEEELYNLIDEGNQLAAKNADEVVAEVVKATGF